MQNTRSNDKGTLMKRVGPHFHRSADNAITAAKTAYGLKCIITGSVFIHGCHIFPRSTYPEVSRCDLLIVPVSGQFHSIQDECMDYKKNDDGCLVERKPYERIVWLLETIPLEKYRELLRNRIYKFIDLYGNECKEVSSEMIVSGYEHLKNIQHEGV